MSNLKAQIEAAFSQVGYPGDGQLTTCPCDECKEIRDYFRGRDWRGHSIAQLRAVETALFHLEPKGFRYLLPAFIMAVIEDPEEAQAIPDLILWNLSPQNTALAIERVGEMTNEECTAVVRFLQFLVEAKIDEQGDVVPALDFLNSRLRET